MAVEKPGLHLAEAAAATTKAATKTTTKAATKTTTKAATKTTTKAPTSTITSTVLPTSTALNSTTIATTLVTTSTQNQSIYTSPSNAVSSQEVEGPVSNKSHTGLIAGIVAGVIILVFLIAGFFFRAKRRRDQESREVEQYQRRMMMHKYSEGSSSIGHGGDESDLQLHRNFYGQQTLMSKQPDWFIKKSPLEYYKQTPTLEELERQKQQQLEEQLKHHRQQEEDRQQQSRPHPLKHEVSDASNTSNSNSSYSTSSSTALAQKGASMAARSLSPSNTNYSPAGEAIALSPTNTHSYQKHQFQHPRISTQGLHRPSSPVTSPFSGSTAKNTYTSSSPMSPHSLSSSTLASTPTYQGLSPPLTQFSIDGLRNYTPPPPISGPFSPVSPSSLPSTGFYDLLDLGEDQQTNHSNNNSRAVESTVSPPPIPRSTRPISVASASSVKFLSTESQPIPDVPALPQAASLPQSS
ncbi:hypothetical protein BGZ80_002154 [Entomortierella chlamydospora]|uniref:Uncharacterized protein n=1 Tax=Entomortierella chlamydospora TaxID=101097 RepID=A0A9P6SXF1_9FUNG|nr:hypothetical protein BGZ79_009061 [Entomortierella chlamydospora]KAG0009689.1 hypothetical protein BGZ80_002154 [Entomortierella chlamydospora]